MRVYTAHLRQPGPDDDLVLVPEGFSFPAFLLGGFWALAHRLWLFAALLFAAEFLVAAFGMVLNLAPMGSVSLSLGVSIIGGYLANDMRRQGLAARGYRDMGVVAAPDADGATQRFVDAHPMLGDAMVRP